MKDGYFLFVNRDGTEEVYMIHHNAKYHYFKDGESLCGKYRMDTNLASTDIPEGDIITAPILACKKCYGKRKTILKCAGSYI